MLVAGAVEVHEVGGPGRVRLAAIDDFYAANLHAFLKGIAAAATAKTLGWSGYAGTPNAIGSHVVGHIAAHVVLP
jgi:hypothetical protein